MVLHEQHGIDAVEHFVDLVLDDPIHANLADDGFAADKFFRYNPSLQRFFDNAAQIDTEIKLGATA